MSLEDASDILWLVALSLLIAILLGFAFYYLWWLPSRRSSSAQPATTGLELPAGASRPATRPSKLRTFLESSKRTKKASTSYAEDDAPPSASYDLPDQPPTFVETPVSDSNDDSYASS